MEESAVEARHEEAALLGDLRERVAHLDEAEGELLLEVARARAARLVPAGEEVPGAHVPVGAAHRVPEGIVTVELVAAEDVEIAA